MMQQDDSQLVLGTPCTGCGVILTPENLAYTTPKGKEVGPLGVCKTCGGNRTVQNPPT